jgi:hypothetical protein
MVAARGVDRSKGQEFMADQRKRSGTVYPKRYPKKFRIQGKAGFTMTPCEYY